MFVSERWGFFVPIIGLAVLALTEAISEFIAGDDAFYQNNPWVKFIGFCVVAAILWPLGRWLNRKAPERTLVDPNTGEQVVLQIGGGNTLFFIPMQFWAPIAIVLGLIFLVSK